MIEISSITTIAQCVTSCDCMSVYGTLCAVSKTANNKKDLVPNIMNFRYYMCIDTHTRDFDWTEYCVKVRVADML